jgi:molybdenum cofactor cytidylyltransferase
MTRIGAVILAAGKSSRFRAGGGSDPTKLVAKLDGKPIVRRVVEAALAAKARPIVVVTGYARHSVEAAVADCDVSLAFNPKFASGLASSLSVGLTAMPRDVVGALVLLGDMPLVGAPLIDALIDAFLARKDALAAVPLREGRRGNPVLLSQKLFERAMRLTGDEGARRLIGALGASDLVEVEAPDIGATFDVDTPDDLAAAQRLRRRLIGPSAIRSNHTPAAAEPAPPLSAATPVRQLSSLRYSRPDLRRSPWSVTCLSPTQRQGELLATQNPDGSLVFSAVLDDDQGLLSFILVPPSAKRTPQRQRYAGSPNS